MKQYFGTDGIRGRANQPPMTPEVALKLGRAIGSFVRQGERRHMVVIGKDTRLSGYMIEHAMVGGLTAAGMDVRLIGPCPTPAIGLLTRSMRADLGIMITASHNPYTDNGIKLFGPDGFKLADDSELEIERLIEQDPDASSVDGEKIGKLDHYKDAYGRYIEGAKASFPRELSLAGIKVVVDCANGGGYKTAPIALWELGADVHPIGVSPNGTNINRECGSTAPDAMIKSVRELGADIGIALDGDADRAILCDEKGHLIDGDQIIARIGKDQYDTGQLRGDGVVTTVMSNFGLERYLTSENLKLIRTQVGDRHVVEAMRSGGYNVGGEQSGHVVLLDHATTGDGLIAALQVLASCVRAQKPASEICHLFEPAPQILINVRYQGASPLELESVQKAQADAEARLGNQGRLVLRKSGTEPLIRVMTQGDDDQLVTSVAEDLAEAIRQAAR
ncbi:MAG: phosphoglucosamine mutase [Oceanicaulis sp.]|uniref:phosphoglucosamine mutase n=1 Tax=Oceanicaulis sp. UBA2681 TaxID=1947007 RepID=UPI000C0B8760|nr:phosphoglucosamine mutase [Oceanicaulis sp. UBA2681]MAP48620.1 phosphoglucosamine mutase [Oceanicaulis sp.]|tara:strand:- start:1616 stop:2959 length:1344 start_codon:yes stop_codon:yes gene_type:complete